MRLVILPVYGRYLWLKTKLQKRAPRVKDWFLLFLANRYLVYFFLVMMSFGVASSNILAYESREDYGQKAVINKIMNISDLETIEDSNTTNIDTQVYTYQLDKNFLDISLAVEPQQGLDYQQSNLQPMITPGGTALIKPSTSGSAADNTYSIREYVVQEGDSVGKLASKFNISVDTILWANNLTFYSIIKPEQKLIIPPVTGVIHKVVKGDTLSKIASKYSAAEEKIREYNRLDDESGLIVGATILVPGGRVVYTQKPRALAYDYGTQAGKRDTAGDIRVTGSGRMSWPIGCYRISQYYKGWRHTGVDIACSWGTTIRAADGGRVLRVQYLRYGYGYNVMINHGDGRVTLYGHLSRIDVSVGDYVSKGQAIGAEGSTGRSTGPHLHFEVRISGATTNPLNYIR